MSHDNRVLEFADRIVHIEDGKVRENSLSQAKYLASHPMMAESVAACGV
ncbi:MAG: hypothetical protein HY046_08015 [Acidobacteria bacterium]|nr:hypothetical protein [Acidobacteriota bacterium]